MPFSSVVGMEDAKSAILCALTNMSIKSMLMVGPPGSAKTVLLRSVNGISDKSVIEMPLGITDEQLFGGLDVESTIKTGIKKTYHGVLGRGDGNVIHIDNANLFDTRTLISVLDSAARGEVIFEREGISCRYECKTTVIATMDPGEGELDHNIMDRFDLCAYVTPPEDHLERTEILRRNLLYDRALSDVYEKEDADVRNKITSAKNMLPYVRISDEIIMMITELCSKVGAKGHRGDIAMVHASMSLAALNKRDEVTIKDVEEASEICLMHRRRNTPAPPHAPHSKKKGEDKEAEGSSNEKKEEGTKPDGEGTGKSDHGKHSAPETEETIFQAGDAFDIIEYLSKKDVLKKGRSRNGKRALTESTDGTGRYARSRTASHRFRDIAFDATVRAAAPYQRTRDTKGMAVAIEKQDIREKVRKRKCGYTILFLVDASGSLGVRKRMVTVKGAILSMLRESYIKRDHIGLMAFRRESAEMILSPTRSVEYGYKKLDELPTGGKTPLGPAIYEAARFMTSYSRSHPGERCHIVILTDGRANVPMNDGDDANEEALRIAGSVILPGVRWTVVDAGMSRPRFDDAVRLAAKLGASYFTLEGLNAESLAAKVLSEIGI